MTASRPRLTEAQTEQRMLDAAAKTARQHGMMLTLQLQMEQVIQAAGVARAPVYRIWPTREDFTQDVLKHLARESLVPTISATELSAVVREVARRRAAGSAQQDTAGSAQQDTERIAILTELLVEAADIDVEALLNSSAWRTYLMLSAAAEALPAGTLREEVVAELEKSNQRQLERLSALYCAAGKVLGLTARPDRSYRELTRNVTVLVRGTVAEALRSQRAEEVAEFRKVLRLALRATVGEYLIADPAASLMPNWPDQLIESLAVLGLKPHDSAD